MRTIAFAVVGMLLAHAAHAQMVVIADDYNVTGSGTGFALGSGVNTGINPPATRLTGSAASGLSYLQTATGKTPANYSIANNALTVARSAGSGRFTLSGNGTSAFDFGGVLGSGAATAANPSLYDIRISMANTHPNNTRFSFGLGTIEENANFWDFGLQLYRTNAADTYYQIGKRIDGASWDPTIIESTGSTNDLNKSIFTTASGTSGTEINFLIRIADAGAETGAAFNSRVQVSIDGGATWIYDTETDADLANGFRFDGLGRYFSWDQAGGGTGAGNFTYDNFSVTLTAVPEPSAIALVLFGGALALWRRRS